MVLLFSTLLEHNALESRTFWTFHLHPRYFKHWKLTISTDVLCILLSYKIIVDTFRNGRVVWVQKAISFGQENVQLLPLLWIPFCQLSWSTPSWKLSNGNLILHCQKAARSVQHDLNKHHSVYFESQPLLLWLKLFETPHYPFLQNCSYPVYRPVTTFTPETTQDDSRSWR